MPLQVIGAGFGRTGTNSLKLALEQLGFDPCHHMFELREHPEQLPFWQAAARGDEMDWDEVFAGYKASVDWPSAHFWRELSDHFSDSKVILSVRPAESWFKSVHATIYPAMMSAETHDPGPTRERLQMGIDLIVKQVFGGRMDDKDSAIDVFNAHIEQVQATIAPDRLLTYEVAQGWEPLCAFLNVDVPDTLFPRANTTRQFQDRPTGRNADD